MKKRLLSALLPAAALGLAGCGETPSAASASAPPSWTQAEAAQMKSAFVQECSAGFGTGSGDPAVQKYCGCMADYVISRYDPAAVTRMDADMKAGRNTPETEAMLKDIAENGIQACPPPDPQAASNPA